MPLKDLKKPAIVLKEFTVENQKFWIQNVEECYFDVLVNTMVNDYQKEEPLALFSKVYDDIVCKKKYEVVYNQVLRRGYSIVCLTFNALRKPTIAGIHCLDVVPYEEVKDEYIFGHSYLWHLLQFKNICIERNINNYLVGRGIYVFPEFRRKGICSELLKCWFLVCKQHKIGLCMGLISSKYSQLAADRAGLKKLKYLPYDEMRKAFPEKIPKGIEAHTEGIALYYAQA